MNNTASMFAMRALVLVLFFGVWALGTAQAGLTIQPTTWNVVGLDSNNTSTGPAVFPVGARICNTGGTAVTNVSGTFFWDSSNIYINLTGPSTINVPTLAAGSCVDFYYSVAITRTSAAYNATRRYHITVTGDSVASVTTPTPREVYVEKIISQGRNSVNSITGPTTVYVGQTYNYTVNASTATGGYEQLQAFLELSNIIFQVQSISTTYTAPPGGTNDKFYADACGWDNNPVSGTYRSCIGPELYPGQDKAGGTIVTTYTVKVLSTGSTTASTVILDFSGSSYHYNSDYGTKTISITALPPPLTLSKLANPSTASAGATVTYTLRVTNSGPAAYTLTDFIDTPPTSPGSPTYVSGSSTFNGASIANPVSSGSTRTWTGSFLVPANQTRDLTYQMVMPNTPGSYVNTAIAHVNEFQIDTTQSTTDNAPASATVTIPPPDMTITKSHTGNFTQGQVGATYSITATNSGSSPTSAAVSVTDTLPAGLTPTDISGTGWNCVLGTLTCTRNDALAAGASYPAITLKVDVASNAAASVTNSVAVSGGGETNTGNNSASNPTTIIQMPDMTITKSHSGNFTVGVNGSYTLTARNSGFAPTSGTITVVDNLPAGLTVAAIPAPANWNCSTTVVGSSTMTCTSATVVAAGANHPNTITLSVVVAPAAFPSVTNSATISGGGENNVSNNTVTDPTTVNGVSDVRLTKSHSGNFTVGVNGSYTLTASNAGTLATSGTITVVDNLPAGLTVAAIPAPANWNCSTTVVGSSTMTCTSSTVVAAGANHPNSITLSVVVAPAAFPSVTNSATISGGGEPAYNNGNNTVTDPTTVNGVSDVRITKAHSSNFTVGVNGTYTLTASNSGTAATSGTITVVDNLPAGLTVAAIPAPANWNCSTTVVGSSTMTCTSSTVVAAGANHPNTIALLVAVAPAAFPSVTNSATISGGGEPAYNNGNNTVTDPTTVNGVSDVRIAKSHSSNFTVGVNGTYTLTASNAGTLATSGTITVVDNLPTGLTVAAIPAPANWNCSTTVVGSSTMTCTSSTVVAAGANHPNSITLSVVVAPAAFPSVTNSATISGGSEPAYNNGNNTVTDPTTVNGISDVRIAKSHSGNFTVGVNGTYTLTASNAGTLATSGTITVVDNLPTGLTVAAIPAPANWNCSTTVVGSSTMTCTSSTVVAAGANHPNTIPLSVVVAPAAFAASPVTNVVNISGGGEPAYNNGNNSATDPTTVNGAPDLTIAKTHVGNFNQGQIGAQYSITVTNSGSAATDGSMVTVTDTLPAGLNATNISGSGWTCALGTLSCTRNTVLSVGLSYAPITVTVDVATNAPASVTNIVSVSGGGQNNSSNDVASDPTTITAFTSGLVITPDAGTRPSVVAGQSTALFNFTVRNTGNANDRVRFLANGNSAQVTGPAVITDFVIDTDGSQTISGPDTDLKNNPSDVLSASIAPNGFINVIVRVLVDLTATPGQEIIVTLGDASGGPSFDDQPADLSMHEVRTVTTGSSNNLREARGDRKALVDNDAQIFLEMTAPTGPVPLGSDITYEVKVSNPGLRDLTGETLTNAPSGSESGVFIIAPIPIDTVLTSGQTFPAGTLYTVSPLSTDPLAAVWTIAPPVDLTTLKRIAFNVGPTLIPGAISTPINFTVTITTTDASTPIKEIADTFGRNSINAPLTDQSGDISRTVGDGNANFDEGPERGTIDGDGVIQITTLQAVGGVLIGPMGQPAAVGPSDTNDDYTNRSITTGLAGVAPGGSTNAIGTVIFTNTVKNTGNANDTFTLTAPNVPFGFTVDISTDNGASYTTVSGGGSVTLPVAYGSQSNILVEVTAPLGQPILTAFPTTIRATSGNNNTVWNETIDRLYTGYLHLVKSQVVTNGTGTGGPTDAVSGAEIQYTVSYTNISSFGGTNNSLLAATNFIAADAIPVSTDFKVGSMTSTPGSTGLVASYEYSNDSGVTWTYTPVSGGGSAPAGYDRNVTNIRWVFAGSLSPITPNNTGTVDFVVRIR